jgi:hypothetical protein
MPSETVTVANAKLTGIAPLFNSGRIRIYSGTAPTNVDTALSGNTLLAELTFGSTAFGAPSNAAMTANSITGDTSADATGTATFFRWFDSTGATAYVQGTVGTSGAELNLNSVSLIAGGTVNITSCVYTQQR